MLQSSHTLHAGVHPDGGSWRLPVLHAALHGHARSTNASLVQRRVRRSRVVLCVREGVCGLMQSLGATLGLHEVVLHGLLIHVCAHASGHGHHGLGWLWRALDG